MQEAHKYINSLVYGRPWAILPEKLTEIESFVAQWAAGRSSADYGAAESPRRPQKTRGVAVLPVFGTISQRANLVTNASGGTSTEQLRAQFRDALQSREVGTIVLQVDSPGGSVAGVPELAADIYAARGTKKIIAVADSLMASAAYWIGSAADEVVVTPSGEVGSIGVVAVHREASVAEADAGIATTVIKAGKYKAEGNGSEPLSEPARLHIQDMVDSFYALFTRAVARHRETTVASVRDGYGEGRTVTATEAVRLGLADRVATFHEVLEKLGAATSTRSLARQAVTTQVRLARARRNYHTRNA